MLAILALSRLLGRQLEKHPSEFDVGRMCALVAWHHDTPLPDATPLTRALQAARVMTDLCLADNPNRTRALNTLLRLSEGELTEARVDGLVDKVRLQSEALMIGLQS